jgi:hypothetical protein
VTVADSRPPRPFGEPVPLPTLCGHEVNAMGECDVEDCPNRWQRCPDCNPAGAAVQADKDAHGRDGT